jgi:hypothetical protein
MLDVEINNNKAKAMYDTGSNTTILAYNSLNKFKHVQFKMKPLAFKTMTGEATFLGIALIKLKIFNISKLIPVCVIDKENLEYNLLIGLDTIKNYKLRQDEDLVISQAPLDNNETPDEDKIKYASLSENQVNWNEAIPIETFNAKVDHLDNEKRKIIYNLIDRYDTLFAKNQYDVGTVSKYQAHITLSEMKYIAKKPYRCSYEDQKEIEKQVAELLKHGMIEESSSPFAAPVTMAFKKVAEGQPKQKIRMCVDFRELNKLLIPEVQPFPLVENLILNTYKRLRIFYCNRYK